MFSCYQNYYITYQSKLKVVGNDIKIISYSSRALKLDKEDVYFRKMSLRSLLSRKVSSCTVHIWHPDCCTFSYTRNIPYFSLIGHKNAERPFFISASFACKSEFTS